MTYSYVVLGCIGFAFFTHPYIVENLHPVLKEFLEKDTNPNIVEKPKLKIWTKWEEEMYNEKISQDEDEGDITLNPVKAV